MIILVNSKVTGSSIQASLGKAEYSYYFLLKLFMPALQQIGQVIEVSSVAEVDPLFAQHRDAGEQVIFLSISPPQQTPTDLQCPTVCLFAWEFPDTPNKAWENNPANDWHYVFSRIAGAIACSKESAQAVRNLMGEDYPVIALPAPVWPQFQNLHPAEGWLPIQAERVFSLSGHIIDSPLLGLSADGLVQHMHRPVAQTSQAVKPTAEPSALRKSYRLLRSWRQALRQRSQAIAANATEENQPAPNQAGLQPVDNCQLSLNGVVFCSMFSPVDGRKNWTDIVTAFCWAFRDTPDATLILKMTHHDLESYRIFLLTMLSRLAPFQCRVVALHGYLDDEQYRNLIQVTDFYVNASTGEGLCLPLMEFLSAGKPALAPKHTAMLDYLNEDIACVVKSSEEPACWSHDPAGTLCSRRHRINWQSLMEGYRHCYQMAQTQPEEYQHMSHRAWTEMQTFSDLPTVVTALQNLFNGCKK